MEASKVINYEQVEPVNVSLTVAMAHLIDRFSFLCEQKLGQVNEHIQHLEVTLALFEAKLNSVPEPVPVVQSAAEPKPATADGELPPMPVGLDEEMPPKPMAGDDAPPMPKGMTNREDPRYKKYFDRLQYGAGLSQIQHDMMRDGIMNYIEILDNPDAPSGGVKEDTSEDESSEFGTESESM